MEKKTLSNLICNEGEKELRGLIVKAQGDYRTYYDNLENIMEIYGDDVIKLYQPTPEDKVKICELIGKLIVEDEKTGEALIDIPDSVVVVELLELLTDVKMDLDKNDTEAIKKITTKPTALLTKIQGEIAIIVQTIYADFLSDYVQTNKSIQAMQNLVDVKYKVQKTTPKAKKKPTTKKKVTKKKEVAEDIIKIEE